MNAMNLSIASLAATVAFVASASLALAQPATISQDTKVREYASNSSYAIDWAYEGQDVNVKKCKGSWCFIKYDGMSGWVKQSRLDFYDDEPAPYYPPQPHYVEPAISFGAYGGQGGVSFGFGLSSY
jgi:uncharacterized protein YraI